MCGVADLLKHLFTSGREAAVEKLEVKVMDLDLINIGPQSITFLAKVNVSNPYCVPIPLGEIRYILKSSGSEIANGTVYDTGSLKGNGDTLLYVDIIVAHNVLASLVKDIAADWDIDYEVHITLIIDLPLICDISIPITKTGEVKLPSLADAFKKHK